MIDYCTCSLLHKKIIDLTGCTKGMKCTECLTIASDIVEAFVETGWRPPLDPDDQTEVDALLFTLWKEKPKEKTNV